MLRDITLGQYYPADSVIHKLDPRVKLFGTLIYIISLFCFRGVAALLLATAFLFVVIKMSKVPFKFMVKGLKAIIILMLITAVFNLFMTPGETLVSFWVLEITKEGATNATIMAIRLTYLILGTSIMTLTTTPNQLTDGLEKSMMPLSKIGVPVHAIAMMMRGSGTRVFLLAPHLTRTSALVLASKSMSLAPKTIAALGSSTTTMLHLTDLLTQAKIAWLVVSKRPHQRPLPR